VLCAELAVVPGAPLALSRSQDSPTRGRNVGLRTSPLCLEHGGFLFEAVVQAGVG
jgi:hypothetical protein